MMLRHDNRPDQIARHARETFLRSTAIIDAEVVTPENGLHPARLRPIHVLRGRPLLFYLVANEGCGVALLHRGERIRIILTGGPTLFGAPMDDHGLDYADGRSTQRFLAAVDRLAGSPLPRGYHRPGTEEPPPPPRRRVTRRR